MNGRCRSPTFASNAAISSFTFQHTDLQVKVAHFVGLDLLQIAVLAVPGPAEHADVSGLDAGDVGALVEVLPMAYDGDFGLGEGPVQAETEAVVDQADAAKAAGIGPRMDDIDVVMRFVLRRE